MIINGRLILLMVATGLFIRVWTANDRGRPHSPRARSQSASNSPPPERLPSLRGSIGATISTVAMVRPGSAAEEVWTPRTAPVPLPHGLSAGIYRVVDDTGRVARLEITQVAAAQPGETAGEPDFCVSTVGNRRWYFIRLHSAQATAPLVTSQVEPLPRANRKFDFTGYESGGR